MGATDGSKATAERGAIIPCRVCAGHASFFILFPYHKVHVLEISFAINYTKLMVACGTLRRIATNSIVAAPSGNAALTSDQINGHTMKAFSNARERDAESWGWLFNMADKRFQFKSITLPKDACMAIVTAEWKE